MLRFELGRAGVNINFTYDEISPLLGVDPFDMYKAIRSIGVEHVTLSSDAASRCFLTNSVEGMRQMRAYMEAFGLNKAELKTVCCAPDSLGWHGGNRVTDRPDQ